MLISWYQPVQPTRPRIIPSAWFEDEQDDALILLLWWFMEWNRYGE
jgi:hypothetical protein